VWSCTGPIGYCGDPVVQRDIAHLTAALDGADAGRAFVPAVSPASLPSLIPDLHYGDADAYRQALADALREEYLAIAAAGFVLQIDDPVLAAAWDWWPDDDLEAYRAETAAQVELLNHALRDIPTEQIRYHLCWGSWQGPHRSDLPLAHIADLMLKVRAGAYVVEAANPRHEHEWRLWRDLHMPEDRLLVPGVVTHKTSVVEHPEVVADRILRYADAVGRERVIAGTDCGMGGRVSSDVAWAKLASLVEGARLASDRLWS
jgi:5-methyltetrahydropteroyltriglutamate--homocysteine methyltransferase